MIKTDKQPPAGGRGCLSAPDNAVLASPELVWPSCWNQQNMPRSSELN